MFEQYYNVSWSRILQITPDGTIEETTEGNYKENIVIFRESILFICFTVVDLPNVPDTDDILQNYI